MKKLEKLLRTPKGFENWLKQVSPNKRIKTGCVYNCPIAEYLIDRGIKFPNVDNHSVCSFKSFSDSCQYDPTKFESPRPISIIEIPHWIAEFVDSIDNLGISKGTFKVSPKECLKILKEIK